MRRAWPRLAPVPGSVVAPVLALLIGALAACGERRVDGSSRDAMMESLAAISRGLDEAESQRFGDAILAITAFELARQEAEQDAHRELRHYLNGLCYEEIVALPEHLDRPRIAEADRWKERPGAKACAEGRR